MKKEIDLPWLRTNFYLLFNRDPKDTDESLEQIFRGIVVKYSEPHRRYHTLAHVEEMLCLLEKYKGIAHNYFHVAFAIWFHDIIWNPKSKRNEEESAFFACEALKIVLSKANVGKMIDEDDRKTAIDFNCALVRTLIMATKHNMRQEDQDCQLICDLDLYRFYGDTAKEDTQDIRFEFSYLSDEEWVRRQADLLTSFPERGYVFQTRTFREAFEQKGMANVIKQAKHFTEQSLKYDRKSARPIFFSVK